ncbi:MAG: PQQ-binding-like beta-propeller repeat protein [Alphaproteobacteria bacterium]|nr:PQQ-binding-like beta-propeller repeat protein [Alphaproteobacteria bacterium]
MMKKILGFLLCAMAIVSCSKRDPILPGVRSDVFDSYEITVKNQELPELSSAATNISGDKDCDYRQDAQNVIWSDDTKIWTGFATNNAVKSEQSPICDDKFIYTGLSTGEVVKVNTANRRLIWSTDVYRANNLTGGASRVDIVAHVGLDGKYVYAGGLGDAFCKLNAISGDTVWCVNISVPVDFIMVDDFIFVVGTDNNLYAINKQNGDVYWKAEIKKQVAPKYDGKNIIVGRQKINYKNGQ